MLDRRDFLKAAAGVTIGFCLAPGLATAQDSLLPPMIRRNPRVDSWLRLDTDGTVKVFTGRVELGQGVRTALAQIVAEELDLSIPVVHIQTVDTDHSPDEGYTFGSVSIQLGGSALRQAAAYLRKVLLTRAAAMLKVSKDALTLDNGYVRAVGKRPLSYADIASVSSMDIEVGEAEHKPVERYTTVGNSVPREDIPAKVFADPVFIQDFRPEGVVHARVVKPPAYTATLKGIDRKGLDDDIDVVQNGSVVAVLSDSEYRAVRAAEQVAANARWAEPERYADSDEAATANDVNVVV